MKLSKKLIANLPKGIIAVMPKRFDGCEFIEVRLSGFSVNPEFWIGKFNLKCSELRSAYEQNS